jgi:magnesium transporter
MIEIFKSYGKEIEQLEKIVNGVWINVVDPTNEEIDRLTRLKIPRDFITYPLDVDERARIEREDDGTMLIVLRIPFYQGSEADVPYITIPLGIVLNEQFILTICCRENEIIQPFAAGLMRNLSTTKRHRFLLRVILKTATKYLTYLRQIDKITEELEDELQVTMRNKGVLELLKYQKSLVYFTTALKANELMLERLQRSPLFVLYPEDEDLLEDVITENQQAIEMTSISSNILNNMMETFSSIISNNMNGVMKLLASMTIIISLPTLITSYYGMNVNLPLQDNPNAYLILMAVSLLISLVVVFYFVKRRWF